MNFVEIEKRIIGKGKPVLVIAEIGVNHNGQLDLAKRLVDAAVEAAADAVKFQTFQADRIVARDAPKADYQLSTTDAAESQYEMLRSLELSVEDHRSLMHYCREWGILFLSTPFDEQSAGLLDDLGVLAFKMGSGELTNLPLLDYVARKGKPLIVSTGMSDLDEVEAAVATVRKAGCRELILLHCVSNYPADPQDVNLRAMGTLQEAFKVPVGFSDHTPGFEVALAAVALGACVIEKHITLDKQLSGPDHKMSQNPAEFKELVAGIRAVEKALGNGVKEPAASEGPIRRVARRSMMAKIDIVEGTVLSRDMLVALRPGDGIPPSMIDQLMGRRTTRSLKAGQLIAWDDLE